MESLCNVQRISKLNSNSLAALFLLLACFLLGASLVLVHISSLPCNFDQRFWNSEKLKFYLFFSCAFPDNFRYVHRRMKGQARVNVGVYTPCKHGLLLSNSSSNISQFTK